MPLFEFNCKCGTKFELILSAKDKNKKPCPKCGKQVEKEKFASTSVIFKGSGFYQNDYKS